MLFLTPFVLADCYSPSDLERINRSVVFCSDTFDAPNGIFITTSNITVDCNSAIIRGTKGFSDAGITLVNVSDVTLKNCNVVTYANGILLKGVRYSLITDNNLLKNDVGIRLFDSYENRIVDNNDKSLVRAVSAIASRFNVVALGNKRVDEGFCGHNSCDGSPVDPCVDGDGYCGSCDDSDCRPVEVSVETPVDTRSADEIIEDIREEIVVEEDSVPVQDRTEAVDKDLSFAAKALVYLVFYLAAFIIAQVYLFRKR